MSTSVWLTQPIDVSSEARQVATPATNVTPGEFLSFRLGAEEFAIHILLVQEIRSAVEPTRIANAAAFVKGVVNLRGAIVPIIDLRARLGYSQGSALAEGAVIVLSIRDAVVGVAVDSVSDVIALSYDQIRAAPAMGQRAGDNFVRGFACVSGTDRERMLVLLDIEGLMASKLPGESADEVGNSRLSA